MGGPNEILEGFHFRSGTLC